MQSSLLAWLDNTANQRIHATTKRRPIELLMDEDLHDFKEAAKINIISDKLDIAPESRRFSFVDAPVIPIRPLSAYEEIAL
jgi:hypothetical protein